MVSGKRAFRMVYGRPKVVGPKAIRGTVPGPLALLKTFEITHHFPAPESPSHHHPCFGHAPSLWAFPHTQLEGSLEHLAHIRPELPNMPIMPMSLFMCCLSPHPIPTGLTPTVVPLQPPQPPHCPHKCIRPTLASGPLHLLFPVPRSLSSGLSF